MYSHLAQILHGFYSPQYNDIRVNILLFIYEYRNHTKIGIDTRQIRYAFPYLSSSGIRGHIVVLQKSQIIYPPQEVDNIYILKPHIISFLEELERVSSYQEISFPQLLTHVGYIGKHPRRLELLHTIYTHAPLTCQQLRSETRIDMTNLRHMVDTLVTYSLIEKWIENGKATVQITPRGHEIICLILTYLA